MDAESFRRGLTGIYQMGQFGGDPGGYYDVLTDDHARLLSALSAAPAAKGEATWTEVDPKDERTWPGEGTAMDMLVEYRHGLRWLTRPNQLRAAIISGDASVAACRWMPWPGATP